MFFCSYGIKGDVPKYDASLDWGANFARMLGYNNKSFEELMRLYLVLHADHEVFFFFFFREKFESSIEMIGWKC